MEIILKEDVVNLGYKNDIVNVKSGYGRNYLIPTGKAVIASPSAKKMLAEELKQRAHKLEKIKKDAEAMAALKDKYSEEDLRDALEEMHGLQDEGLLFSPSFDVPPTFAEKPIVKSLCLLVTHDCNLRLRRVRASR